MFSGYTEVAKKWLGVSSKPQVAKDSSLSLGVTASPVSIASSSASVATHVRQPPKSKNARLQAEMKADKERRQQAKAKEKAEIEEEEYQEDHEEEEEEEEREEEADEEVSKELEEEVQELMAPPDDVVEDDKTEDEFQRPIARKGKAKKKPAFVGKGKGKGIKRKAPDNGDIDMDMGGDFVDEEPRKKHRGRPKGVTSPKTWSRKAQKNSPCRSECRDSPEAHSGLVPEQGNRQDGFGSKPPDARGCPCSHRAGLLLGHEG